LQQGQRNDQLGCSPAGNDDYRNQIDWLGCAISRRKVRDIAQRFDHLNRQKACGLADSKSNKITGLQ